MQFGVQLPDLERIMAKSRHPAALLAEPMRNFFTRSTLLLQGAAMAEAPTRTGHLRRSHTTEIDRSPVPMWGKVGVNVPYGRFVHDGTKPHVITAHGSVLRFMVGGQPVYRRQVQHPGTKPNPWLKRAYRRSTTAIKAALAVTGQQIGAKWSQR